MAAASPTATCWATSWRRHKPDDSCALERVDTPSLGGLARLRGAVAGCLSKRSLQSSREMHPRDAEIGSELQCPRVLRRSDRLQDPRRSALASAPVGDQAFCGRAFVLRRLGRRKPVPTGCISRVHCSSEPISASRRRISRELYTGQAFRCRSGMGVLVPVR